MEIENIEIKDEYAQNNLSCGLNEFEIISLAESFYLSISLENYCLDNFRFQITFYCPSLKKNLALIEINEKRSIKKIFKFSKFERNQNLNCWTDLIQINWESLDMKANGILEIMTDFESFRNKIFVSPVNN